MQTDDVKEQNREQTTRLQNPLESNPSKGEQKDLLSESHVAQLEIEASYPIVKEPSSLEDATKVGILTAEVKSLKVIISSFFNINHHHYHIASFLICFSILLI